MFEQRPEVATMKELEVTEPLSGEWSNFIIIVSNYNMWPVRTDPEKIHYIPLYPLHHQRLHLSDGTAY